MVSRMDLDGPGSGSPAGLVNLIFKKVPMTIPVPIEELCSQLDIQEIAPLPNPGFAGSLLTTPERNRGIILVQDDLPPQKRRFTIAHELGHFLLPSHIPDQPGQFLCSMEDMLRLDPKELGRRQKMEVEANLFASLILIPPPILKQRFGRNADIAEIITLARDFHVSKEAMTRAYVMSHSEALAAVVVHEGLVQRIYKNQMLFKPYIEVGVGQPVDGNSLYHEVGNTRSNPSRWMECDPETWLGLSRQNNRLALSEQVLLQQDGYALILLKADLPDEDEEDDDEPPLPRFRQRF